MKLYAVRLIEDQQAVGFFWATDDQSLVAMVDCVVEPDHCEFQQVHEDGALVWESATTTLGVDRSHLSDDERSEQERKLGSGITPLRALEDFFYDEVELWTPMEVLWQFETWPPSKRVIRSDPLPKPPVEIHTPKNIVYFIKAGNHIKIGQTSGSIDRRIKSLATGHYDQMTALAVIEDAPAPLEFELHQRFAAYRVRGEWFKAAPELLAYIEEINAGKK